MNFAFIRRSSYKLKSKIATTKNNHKTNSLQLKFFVVLEA